MPKVTKFEDENLRRMLKTPPKPHAAMKHPRVKRAELGRSKATKRYKA